MSELGLGKLIEGEQERDAVHVAVAPCVSAVKLAPGQDVGLIDGGQLAGPSESPIGIVDPFLKAMVQPGQKFWLFLYPNTVTGMRHRWEHPSFDDVAVSPSNPTKEESEAWLRHFCETEDCPDYETTIAAASCDHVVGISDYGEAYRYEGEYLLFNGRDAHADIPPEFWDHVENVTGVICVDRPRYFSCSC